MRLFRPESTSFRRRFLAIILVASAALAALPCVSHSDHAEEVPGEERSWYNVDTPHEALSGQVEQMARKLDAFFAGERTYEESTGSYMKVSGSTIWLEGGEFDYKYSLKLKLTLPNTKKRFKLILDSEPDDGEDDAEDSLPEGEDTLAGAVDQTTYNLALRYLALATETLQLSIDAGVRLRWPPDPFVRLRGRRSLLLGDWEARGIQSFEYSVDDHFVSTTTLELDRRLSSDFLYRNYATAKYGSQYDKFLLGAGVRLFQTLSSRDALTYKAGAKGESHPVFRHTSYNAGVTYRRRLYNKWLFGSLTPELTWPASNGFSPIASLTLKIEMVFGDRALGSVK